MFPPQSSPHPQLWHAGEPHVFPTYAITLPAVFLLRRLSSRLSHLESDPRAGGIVGATEGWEARRTKNPGARPGALWCGERQHVSLVHAQKQGSEARLPGERAWRPGTSPLTLAGAPCLNFPLCKAEMMIVPAAQGSLLYLQQRGRLCHQADAISLVWPVSAGHGALRGGSCPQGVGSPSSSPHYPQGPPLFPTNCH